MKSKTDAELKQLAADMYNGKIFSSLHVKEARDVRMVFMPISLGAFSELSEQEREDIGLIYEYKGDEGPYSVNGYPIFFSFKVLNITDSKKMADYYFEYKEIQEQFLREEKKGGTDERS